MLHFLQYSAALLGYAEEQETTVLELTYNYRITEGNAYAQVTQIDYITFRRPKLLSLASMYALMIKLMQCL